MTMVTQSGGYLGTQRPSLEDLDLCTRCGLCEQACPTYRLLHFEPDSPRGRVFLMKQVAEGHAPVNEHLAEHLYQCLGCRACETVCPSSVPFGRLLEYGRYQIELRGELSPQRRGWRLFRAFTFERVLPNPWLFRALMLPAQALQRLPGLQRLAQALPLPRSLAQLVRLIPERASATPGRSSKLDRSINRSKDPLLHKTVEQARPLHGGSKEPLLHKSSELKRSSVIPAQGERRARVGLFLGCVMSSLFAHVHAATIRVLSRNGCEVVIVPGQWCCGALNVHAGERSHAARMARRNVVAFARVQLDAIIVNSAGCGAVLKEYGELLKEDATGPAAIEFAAKVKDISEFLAQLGLRSGLHPVRKRITYQDACHLAHGQGVREQPRALLKRIPGVDYVELRYADRCCGAAGVYSLTHPELAGRLLAEKIDEVAQTGAEIIATANPGCAMQLQAGIRHRNLPMRVCHVVELLDRSYNTGP